MAQISITDFNGEPYVPSEGDLVRFAMKVHYTDEDTLLVKDIPIDTLKLVLNSEDTKAHDSQILNTANEVI